MVVIDPISAYMGVADSHNNADVRSILAPLSELAAKHRVAIVAVSHLNKGSGPRNVPGDGFARLCSGGKGCMGRCER